MYLCVIIKKLETMTYNSHEDAWAAHQAEAEAEAASNAEYEYNKMREERELDEQEVERLQELIIHYQDMIFDLQERVHEILTGN
jgi:G:T-mismatch repair DNA endonuclease (very short patch repair protein)